MSVVGDERNIKVEEETDLKRNCRSCVWKIFLEMASIFRIGLPLFSEILGRKEQLCVTEFLCLFSKENCNPWFVASQLFAVGMIIDQKQKDYIPFKSK